MPSAFISISHGDPITATTRKNLIDRIAVRTGKPQTLVKTVVPQLFAEIITQLAPANRVKLRNVAVFQTRTTPARTARPPRMRQKIQVSAELRVVLKPGRLLKQQLHRKSRS